MAEVQKGFFWHVHHEVLIEWCYYSYDGRASFIRTDKPKSEQETRLRLFKPVKGTLPREVVEAGQALDKASQAYVKAWQAYVETGRAYDEASQAYQAYDEAWQVLNEALRKNMPAIEALHKEECHNCPWDGKTIFPGS
ncbi:MAG: hypothetical protein UT43_C0008G0013 [Parcubacteria group bacterium GW2011_GWC1_39_29]|nr:MAG: hypothetical protein UT43_C0008G0013 [Parcubacteria group bacterium GW2011_GWC1_39_29]